MRKVSIEMNLGKKTQARFPRRVQSNLKLKIQAPANEAKPLPPLGPALTIYGVDAKSFCEDFNHMSKDYDNGFNISMNIWITQTKNYIYNFRSPSCFNLFHRCFDFYEATDLNLNKKTIMLLSINLALIKNVSSNSIFLHKIQADIKQIFGSLRSYGFFSKKKKQKKNSQFLRINSDIKNSKFTRKKI